MKNEKITSETYTFSNDYAIIEALHPTPAALIDKIHDYHIMAQKGKASAVDVLLKEIRRYPNYPELKTLLMMLYHNLGEYNKSQEWALKTIELHPDYLPGKVNACFVHFDNGDFELMQEIMGKGFHLKDLYPNRTVFHTDEMILTQKVAVHYYGALGDIEQAKIRLDIMNNLAPESPETLATQRFFTLASVKHGKIDGISKEMLLSMMPKDLLELDIHPEFERPHLLHVELYDLFDFGFDITEEILDDIRSLPTEEVIQDLETIVQFAIEEYDLLAEQETPEEQTYFLSHAMQLLADLKAYESLPLVLHVFEQDEDFIQFFFGDFAEEFSWDIIMTLGLNQLDVLLDYMMRPGIYTYNRVIICQAVHQMYFHHPEKKADVVKFYESMLTFFIETEDENVIDRDLNAMISWQLVDIRESRLIELMDKMYDLDIVEEDVLGTRESFHEMLDFPDQNDPLFKIYSLTEKYDRFTSKTANDNTDLVDDPLPIPPLLPLLTDLKPNIPVNTTKIGRNEPCPCGSGKKYKKCCLKD